jgi:hypothetical protein
MPFLSGATLIEIDGRGPMRNGAAIACVLSLAVHPVAAAAPRPEAVFTDPVQGFSLAVPALGESSNAPMLQRVVVSGAPEGGFSANCNVQVQFVTMSIEAFVDLSVRQFAAMDFKIHEQKKRTVSGRPAATFEYSGELSEKKLRFSSLAVGGQDRIWLLTCTALEERFEKYRPEFARAIDSFALVELAKPD